FAGIAGALGTLTIQFVAPDIFTIFFAISLLVGALIGGVATISGCFYGALFILFVPNFSEEISKSAPQLIYGILLTAGMILMPGGIASLVKKIFKKFI